MPSELAQWITPAIVIVGFLFTARTIRNQRVEMGSRMDRMESRLAGRIEGVESRLAARIDGLESQTSDLRDRMELRTSDLRDRMGRIEGTLDVLREFFVGTGRGSVA